MKVIYYFPETMKVVIVYVKGQESIVLLDIKRCLNSNSIYLRRDILNMILYPKSFLQHY